MSLKIGELAQRAGLTVRTLHHYDSIGLLSPSVRSDSGYRLYSQADVVRLHRIQALKQFGCSLGQIRDFLAEPGASPIEIVSQQISVLEEQARRAQTLRDRLSLLREQLSRGEEAGLADWLTILEMMTLYEKHLSKHELDTVLSRKAAGGLHEEWRELASTVRTFMERGVSVESRDAQDLAWSWMRLLRDTTGNDAGLAMKLLTIHREGQEAGLFKGIRPEMIEYLKRAYANARAAILAQYVSPAELENVRSRQAARVFEWPPLIVEARRQMERGTAPETQEMQALAGRWESLFRESYSGEDRELEGKIRAAFRREPKLLTSLGIDGALIAFMEKAASYWRRVRVNAGTCPDGVPRATALRVAFYRAAHQLLDAPLIFEDPLALKVLGEAGEASLRRDLEQYNAPLIKGVRIAVALRSRVAEDDWTKARQNGVRQFVILGAGLDTYAYRHRPLDQKSGPGENRIFELDLPDTQQWKRQCLRTAGIEEPPWLTFVPVDFERSSLPEALGLAGFRANEPAFFSWLGVTMYLELEAILSTLRFIASLAPESGVVFDYTVSPSLLSPRERSAVEALASRAAQAGEPWKTYFDPASLAETLRSIGFRTVKDHGAAELNERYLSGRTDGLRKSGTSRVICARV